MAGQATFHALQLGLSLHGAQSLLLDANLLFFQLHLQQAEVVVIVVVVVVVVVAVTAVVVVVV